MSSVKVKIDILPRKESIASYSLSASGNNISNSSAMKTEHNGMTPFVMGASRLGLGDKLHSSATLYSGYFARQLTSSSGDTNITITIHGTKIDAFVITFDRAACQHATRLSVDGIEFENSNPRFIWRGTAANSHTIKILKWNRPLYPVRITSIIAGLSAEYDSSVLQEVVRGSQMTANNNLPTYGVLSQYGSVVIVDKDKELLRLAELEMLFPEQSVNIYFGAQLLGKYETEKWSYTIDNGKATVQLKDNLIKWSDINFDGIKMTENKTAMDVFNCLIAVTPNEQFILPSEVASHLNSIKIRFCSLEKGKLIEAWNKLCNLAQLLIYKTEEGKIRVTRWQ